MDGVTDHVFRAIMTAQSRGHSGIDLCVSEFVRVSQQKLPPKVFYRHCPELRSGGCTASGVPVFVQLLGGDPVNMAYHGRMAAQLGAVGIDLNFGCPAKTVNNHDGGASLLKTPQRVAAVTRAVREAVPAEIPVTAKIRLGWSDAEQVEAIARAAEQGGASWLTIHARTRTQLYRPPVDWRSIGRARAAVNIPVIANGDIVDGASYHACRSESGCDAVMIGRGAMAHPDLFAQIAGIERGDFRYPELLRMLDSYIEAYIELEGSSGAHKALLRLKQWLRMASPIRPGLQSLFDTVKRRRALEDARADLDQFVGDSGEFE